MSPHPAQMSLVFFSFSVAALYGPALLAVLGLYVYLSRKKSRVSRREEKHRRIREAIVARGQAKRRKLALVLQRDNIRELAVIVREQLEANKLRMTPYMHQRTSVFIEKTVTVVDFDGLLALHRYLADADPGQVPLVMDLFFEQTR
ncbi:hypothetical protein [Solidesulfovibrio alcoholivorans]|uniref:hypothetical protein n=1 Tax=Solidesulfovibrio alcoholivorans TaxID=81406 RepID=UPI0004973110|nr:hypothetical protein [Solidesulfovibrio alcoholivorans]